MRKETREKYLLRAKAGVKIDQFAPLVEEWLAYIKIDSASSSTITDYKTKVNLFHLWLKQNFPENSTHPKLVTVDIARKFAEYLKTPQSNRWNRAARNAVLSEVSIESYGRNMKIFYNWLLKKGYVELNPFSPQYVKFRSGKKDKTIKVLTTEEIVKLFKYLDQHRATFTQKRDYALIALALDQWSKAIRTIIYENTGCGYAEDVFQSTG